MCANSKLLILSLSIYIYSSTYFPHWDIGLMLVYEFLAIENERTQELDQYIKTPSTYTKTEETKNWSDWIRILRTSLPKIIIAKTEKPSSNDQEWNKFLTTPFFQPLKSANLVKNMKEVMAETHTKGESAQKGPSFSSWYHQSHKSSWISKQVSNFNCRWEMGKNFLLDEVMGNNNPWAHPIFMCFFFFFKLLVGVCVTKMASKRQIYPKSWQEHWNLL